MQSENLFKRYLELLDLKLSNPSFEFLCEITKAHLIKVPFENISKLLHKAKGANYIPDLETYLDGIEKYNFGGTCYSNNFYLYLLLKYIGYNVTLCGADMKKPDVHLINIVTINSKKFIVDGGYAAPFLNPIPTEQTEDYIVNLGNETYLVKPKDESGRTKVEQHYNNKLQHWYTVNPAPRVIEDFRNVIEDSYSDDAIFTNTIRITKFSENGSPILKNLMLTENSYSNTSVVEISRKEIPDIIQKKFGIPADIVFEAISNLRELKNFYS